jgi:hypothetical protein
MYLLDTNICIYIINKHPKSVLKCIFRLERSSSPVKEIHESGKIDPPVRDEIHPGQILTSKNG